MSPSAGSTVVVRSATTGIVTGVGRETVVTSGTATEVSVGGRRVVVAGPNKKLVTDPTKPNETVVVVYVQVVGVTVTRYVAVVGSMTEVVVVTVS
jgi:hypothetical protein